MTLSNQPYKGTRDFYPEQMRIRKWMFGRLAETVERFGFEPYDGPMLEPFELYAAKTGEEIVNQQLYWLVDRGERKLAIRPEMTPTLARMVAARFHELPRPVRWYSLPNLWRYERPQRGRLREHWQLNVDILGGDPLLADAELLTAAYDLIRAFGGERFIEIKVNHRGLMDFLFTQKLGLSTETAHRVTKLIDARAKMGEEAYQQALSETGIKPVQVEVMEEFFKSSFEKIKKDLPCPGVETLSKIFALLEENSRASEAHQELRSRVVFDPQILRGLDYYTGTVFEIYDVSPENRRALFGGGRYDNLLGIFGKYQLSGIGFGMGDVGLENFLETHQLLPALPGGVDVFVTLPALHLRGEAEKIVALLREAGVKVATPLSEGGFGAQLKLADKHHARFAVLIGEEELKEGKVILKKLATGLQLTLKPTELLSEVKK